MLLAPVAILTGLLRREEAVGEGFILLLGIPTLLLFILLTIRRLRDARLLWTALFGLFPFTLWVELGPLRWGTIDVRLIDLGALIRLAPVMVGLIMPSRLPQEPD